MAYGRGASVRDAAARGSTSAPMEEAMPVSPQGVIDNDDHPDDRGLHATQEDHWGTVNSAIEAIRNEIRSNPNADLKRRAFEPSIRKEDK